MKLGIQIEVQEFAAVKGVLVSRAVVKLGFVVELLIGIAVDLQSNIVLVAPDGVVPGKYLQERITAIVQQKLKERDEVAKGLAVGAPPALKVVE